MKIPMKGLAIMLKSLNGLVKWVKSLLISLTTEFWRIDVGE